MHVTLIKGLMGRSLGPSSSSRFITCTQIIAPFDFMNKTEICVMAYDHGKTLLDFKSFDE